MNLYFQIQFADLLLNNFEYTLLNTKNSIIDWEALPALSTYL